MNTLARTPPPSENNNFQPNLAHTPPPPLPPNPPLSTVNPPHPSPRPRSHSTNPISQSDYMSCLNDESPRGLKAATPSSEYGGRHHSRYRGSDDRGIMSDTGNYGIGSSPPSLCGFYGGATGLYSSSHISSGIYSGSASLGSIYGSAPPVPPPPLEEPSTIAHHRREHSMNSIHSIHSVNSFREFYDKSSLNQFISTSPKLSNRYSILKVVLY